jgi:outer membrane protein assembly factor BamB
MINKKKYFIFIILIISLNHCSFDKKSGIWKGYEKEVKRVGELEEQNESFKSKVKVFSTSDEFAKEVNAKEEMSLKEPAKNIAWAMPGLNLQNSLGNLALGGFQNKFLSDKVGKNKFALLQKIQSPLFYENNLVLSDDKGTLYKINRKGQKYWKVNIYGKIYKKLHKNLTFAIYNKTIYVADNIGFIYGVNFDNGNIIWKKNFGVPFKSRIKIFNDKIYIIDQDNRMLSLNIKDGSKVWDIPTLRTFIKSQDLLGLAVTKNGDLVFLNTTGDVLKVNSTNGRIYWSINSLTSLSAFVTDFFNSSDIVINENNAIFSSGKSTFSLNLQTGYVNWIAKLRSNNIPIIDKDNVFLVTNEGFYVNLNKKNGKIIWSTNILNSIKKKHRSTRISGFVMGSDKIIATTLNGYLIVCSAINGKVEYIKKISDSINSNPIIANNELYILTTSSKVLGFK